MAVPKHPVPILPMITGVWWNPQSCKWKNANAIIRTLHLENRLDPSALDH